MKTTGVLVLAITAICFSTATSARAALVTVNPANVNRLIYHQPGNYQYVHFSDYFSTFLSNPTDPYFINEQRTLLYTPGTDFHNALVSALGTTNYGISSVQLVVGSSTKNEWGYGPYTSQGAKGAYTVLMAYNPATVTWVSFNNGGVAGTDYSSTALATGTNIGDTVVWTFPPALINGWITEPESNLGLMFPDHGTATDEQDTTPVYNVEWRLNAAAVPEPGTWAVVALLAGTAGYVRWRRRTAA